MPSASTTAKPSSSYEFDKATKVHPLGVNDWGDAVFTGQLDKQWVLRGVILGGYLTSMMLKTAMEHHPNRAPAALTAFFTSPARPGPCVIEIKDLKISKKGYSTVTVTLKQLKKNNYQDKRPPVTVQEYNAKDYEMKCYTVITLMGHNQIETGPTIIHPDAAAALIDRSSTTMQPVDLQMGGGEKTIVSLQDLNAKNLTATAESHHAFSFSDNRPINSIALPYFADMYEHPLHMLADATYMRLQNTHAWKPTLQYEVQFKYPIMPKTTTQILASFKVPHLIQGRFDMDGVLYTPDGKIVATTRSERRDKVQEQKKSKL
ncbi:thioesterase-like superfamily-domain-containing protein [Zychaea mexicana]|uniref:thioesterase-like superfamily-domain-containing protein n=1 Tax=Zychaea mexicana TaxID=64656 RepID=UPI0022FF37A7|nr:thioesterase-like superfamily-domain-containing protein [Zychaea mexicana]KAI9495242.1 thioesterase-like superfamily-domain-containing protein [Zychaea mexicana]